VSLLFRSHWNVHAQGSTSSDIYFWSSSGWHMRRKFISEKILLKRMKFLCLFFNEVKSSSIVVFFIHMLLNLKMRELAQWNLWLVKKRKGGTWMICMVSWGWIKMSGSLSRFTSSSQINLENYKLLHWNVTIRISVTMIIHITIIIVKIYGPSLSLFYFMPGTQNSLADEQSLNRFAFILSWHKNASRHIDFPSPSQWCW